MIELISIYDPITYVLGGGASVTAIIYFIRHVRRIFYTEKRDTSIDQASQSLFENLRLENQRMSDHMATMSEQLQKLSKENQELNIKIADLTISVRKLVTLEKENIDLQEKLIIKESILIEHEKRIEELTNTLNEALAVVKLRKN